MLKRQAYIFSRIAIAIDLAITAGSFLLTYYVRNNIPGLIELYPLGHYAWILFAILFLWAILLTSFGVYDFLKSRSLRNISLAILKTIVVGLTIIIVVLFLLRDHTISRILLLSFGGLNFIFLASEKVFLTFLQKSAVQAKRYHWTQILIVGSGKEAQRLVEMAEGNPHWGLKILGSLDFDSSKVGKIIRGCRVLGLASNLQEFLRSHVVDQVVFNLSFEFWDRLPELLRACEEVGVPSHVLAEFSHSGRVRIEASDLFGIPALSFSTTPEWGWALLLKEIFDRVAAFFVLIILSPLFLIIALGLKFSSPGSILFRQQRCGVNGRKFILYKFRSMVENAEQMQEEIKDLSETTGPVFKIRSDPRLTKFGRILRRSTLDELPQLINVLKGEVSLVGPRPPIPSEVEKYDIWQRRRLSVRPGMTCLWQISGRSELGFDKWMELDLAYIDNWSLWLDFKILWKTIPAILSGRGAY